MGRGNGTKGRKADSRAPRTVMMDLGAFRHFSYVMPGRDLPESKPYWTRVLHMRFAPPERVREEARQLMFHERLDKMMRTAHTKG